jgi:hypothetical protein
MSGSLPGSASAKITGLAHRLLRLNSIRGNHVMLSPLSTPDEAKGEGDMRTNTRPESQ